MGDFNAHNTIDESSESLGWSENPGELTISGTKSAFQENFQKLLSSNIQKWNSLLRDTEKYLTNVNGHVTITTIQSDGQPTGSISVDTASLKEDLNFLHSLSDAPNKRAFLEANENFTPSLLWLELHRYFFEHDEEAEIVLKISKNIFELYQTALSLTKMDERKRDLGILGLKHLIESNREYTSLDFEEIQEYVLSTLSRLELDSEEIITAFHSSESKYKSEYLEVLAIHSHADFVNFYKENKELCTDVFNGTQSWVNIGQLEVSVGHVPEKKTLAVAMLEKKIITVEEFFQLVPEASLQQLISTLKVVDYIIESRDTAAFVNLCHQDVEELFYEGQIEKYVSVLLQDGNVSDARLILELAREEFEDDEEFEALEKLVEAK